MHVASIEAFGGGVHENVDNACGRCMLHIRVAWYVLLNCEQLKTHIHNIMDMYISLYMDVCEMDVCTCVCVSQTVYTTIQQQQQQQQLCMSLCLLSACLHVCVLACLHASVLACVLVINISATSVSVRCTLDEKQSGGEAHCRVR